LTPKSGKPMSYFRTLMRRQASRSILRQGNRILSMSHHSSPMTLKATRCFLVIFDPKTLKMINPENKGAYEIASFDPENGTPLDAQGNKLPYDDKEKCFKDLKGKKISSKYHPTTFRCMDLRTGKSFVGKNYDPDTGRPYRSSTGKLFPLDPETGIPFDPQNGSSKPGLFDFKTGLPIDPETGKANSQREVRH
jgi:hypothetical protein